MTEPLTPPECDLTDFASMFFDVQRLLTSETWIEAAETPRLGHVLMCLWMESWHQRPAASLPNNDAVLARLAMCDGRTWKRLRDKAMEGWVMCSDGRWYHPVVAEKALEAWLEKLAQRLSSGAGNAKRWGVDFDPVAFERDIDRAASLLAELNPQSRGIAKAARRKSQKQSVGNTVGNPGAIPSGSQETETGTGIIPPKPPTGGRRGSSSAVPDGFPTADLIEQQQAKARDQGKDLDIANQADRFRNWALGKDARYVDWGATWRNWCDRAIRDAPAGRPSSVSAPSVWPDRARAWRELNRWNPAWGPRPDEPGCACPPDLLEG